MGEKAPLSCESAERYRPYRSYESHPADPLRVNISYRSVHVNGMGPLDLFILSAAYVPDI